jgi:hypothetical protein
VNLVACLQQRLQAGDLLLQVEGAFEFHHSSFSRAIDCARKQVMPRQSRFTGLAK